MATSSKPPQDTAPEPTDEAPEPAPVPIPHDEPDWARRLRETLEALPGKLTATVSDDDRRGIAEAVHGLFESSGAFRKDDEPEPPSADRDAPPSDDGPPRKESWADRHFK